jgi:hypothetical protein
MTTGHKNFKIIVTITRGRWYEATIFSALGEIWAVVVHSMKAATTGQVVQECKALIDSHLARPTHYGSWQNKDRELDQLEQSRRKRKRPAPCGTGLGLPH